MIDHIDIASSNYQPTDKLKKYINKKVGRLDRVVPRSRRQGIYADVILTELKTKNNRNKCEIILHLPDQKLIASESTVNMFAAVDVAETKIRSQLRKYKDTHGGDMRDHGGRLRMLFRNRRNR